MEHSEVFFHELEPVSLRIDAEYYRPRFVEIEKKIKKISWDFLSNLRVSIKSFGAYSLCNNVHYKESGVPFLRCKDIKHGDIDFSDVLFIDEETNALLPKSEVLPNSVLFTMSGTVGNSAIASKDLKYPINSNQDIAKIITNKKIDPYTLSIFLQSKYGKGQVDRLPIGSVQQHVFLWQLDRLAIPLFNESFETLLKNTYLLSHTSRISSTNLLQESQNVLLSDLGLSNWEPLHELSFINKFSEVQKSSRIDAEFFQPKKIDVETHLISKCNAEKIGDIDFIEVTTGQYAESYVDEKDGIPYIRGTNISNLTVDEENLVYIDPQNLFLDKKANENDVVVTRVGTIGLTARIPKKFDGSAISDNLIRIRFDKNKLNPYYLANFLGGSLGKILMVENSRGSVQQRLNQGTLKEIVIPLVPKKSQEKIEFLIIKSERTMDQSKRYFEAVKKAVEIAIEKDEKIAIDWLNAQIKSIGRLP